MRTTSSLAVRAALGLTLALGTFGLAACGSDSTADDSTSPTTTAATDSATPDSTETADAAAQADAFTITDPWVKAAKEGMTAVFGTMADTGDQEIVVTEATSDIATMMELHETVAKDDGSMAMQPKEGGFSIPAGGEHELAPGGDHLMVMGLTRPLKAGEMVTVTVTFADGSTTDFEATVKNFSGADEKYEGGEQHK